MADQLRLRGGPTAESAAFVGAEREVTVDTGLKALRIHDGVTPGGHLVRLKADAEQAITNLDTSSGNARQALQDFLIGTIQTETTNRTTAITSVTSQFLAGDTTVLADAKAYADQKITDTIGGAPALLDTLNELAAAIGDDEDFISTITTSVATVQADVDANETAANLAIATVQNDVNVNEIATNAAIAVVQADVDSNEAVALSGRTTLSNRLDTLEADPTTATALASQLTTVQGLIAAIQTDVDLNESDADAAISAEEAARIAADGVLTSAVSSEATSRATADTALQINITAEETSRVADVASLTATINSNEAAHVVSHNGLQSSIDTINTDRTALEERLLQAGLATGLLYVSNFAGG